MANLSFYKRLYGSKHHHVSMSGCLKYASKTLNKANSRIKDSEDYELSGNAILDLGLKYGYHDTLQLALDLDNVFDRTYYIGGSFYLPYTALGRTLMATISLNL